MPLLLRSADLIALILRPIESAVAEAARALDARLGSELAEPETREESRLTPPSTGESAVRPPAPRLRPLARVGSPPLDKAASAKEESARHAATAPAPLASSPPAKGVSRHILRPRPPLSRPAPLKAQEISTGRMETHEHAWTAAPLAPATARDSLAADKPNAQADVPAQGAANPGAEKRLPAGHQVSSADDWGAPSGKGEGPQMPPHPSLAYAHSAAPEQGFMKRPVSVRFAQNSAGAMPKGAADASRDASAPGTTSAPGAAGSHGFGFAEPTRRAEPATPPQGSRRRRLLVQPVEPRPAPPIGTPSLTREAPRAQPARNDSAAVTALAKELAQPVASLWREFQQHSLTTASTPSRPARSEAPDEPLPAATRTFFQVNVNVGSGVGAGPLRGLAGAPAGVPAGLPAGLPAGAPAGVIDREALAAALAEALAEAARREGIEV